MGVTRMDRCFGFGKRRRIRVVTSTVEPSPRSPSAWARVVHSVSASHAWMALTSIWVACWLGKLDMYRRRLSKNGIELAPMSSHHCASQSAPVPKPLVVTRTMQAPPDAASTKDSKVSGLSASASFAHEGGPALLVDEAARGPSR